VGAKRALLSNFQVGILFSIIFFVVVVRILWENRRCQTFLACKTQTQMMSRMIQDPRPIEYVMRTTVCSRNLSSLPSWLPYSLSTLFINNASKCLLFARQNRSVFGFVKHMYLSNTEPLTSLGCPLNAVFNVLRGPVP
jgi:hypothetical protein